MLRISSPLRTWPVFWAAPPLDYKKSYKINKFISNYLILTKNLPINTFLTIKGLLPKGESKPPSMENPKPQLSLTISTQRAPLGVDSSRNYKFNLKV